VKKEPLKVLSNKHFPLTLNKTQHNRESLAGNSILVKMEFRFGWYAKTIHSYMEETLQHYKKNGAKILRSGLICGVTPANSITVDVYHYGQRIERYCGIDDEGPHSMSDLKTTDGWELIIGTEIVRINFSKRMKVERVSHKGNTGRIKYPESVMVQVLQ